MTQGKRATRQAAWPSLGAAWPTVTQSWSSSRPTTPTSSSLLGHCPSDRLPWWLSRCAAHPPFALLLADTLPAHYYHGPSSLAQVCFAGSSDRRSCGSASFPFVVTALPLVAALSGANAVVGTGAVTLDCGRGTSDPDGEPGAIAFGWDCVGPDPAGCFTASGSRLVFTRDPVQVRSHDAPVCARSLDATGVH